jgi:hypothetical protein
VQRTSLVSWSLGYTAIAGMSPILREPHSQLDAKLTLELHRFLQTLRRHSPRRGVSAIASPSRPITKARYGSNFLDRLRAPNIRTSHASKPGLYSSSIQLRTQMLLLTVFR